MTPLRLDRYNMFQCITTVPPSSRVDFDPSGLADPAASASNNDFAPRPSCTILPQLFRITARSPRLCLGKGRCGSMKLSSLCYHRSAMSRPVQDAMRDAGGRVVPILDYQVVWQCEPALALKLGLEVQTEERLGTGRSTHRQVADKHLRSRLRRPSPVVHRLSSASAACAA